MAFNDFEAGAALLAWERALEALQVKMAELADELETCADAGALALAVPVDGGQARQSTHEGDCNE